MEVYISVDKEWVVQLMISYIFVHDICSVTFFKITLILSTIWYLYILLLANMYLNKNNTYSMYVNRKYELFQIISKDSRIIID